MKRIESLLYAKYQKDLKMFTEVATLLKQESFKFRVAYTEELSGEDELSLIISEDNRVFYTIRKAYSNSEDYGLYVRYKENQYNLYKDLFVISHTSETAKEIVEHLKHTKENISSLIAKAMDEQERLTGN
ncbi:hypothetical protein [Bacillus wiedmannii]|uniref:hypothetical protein n=1 Tax=Bacillus wiedmannii TaxID=1890302 RepID=UPI000BF23A8F|nr:hypothetical protein [Bacillus wiedmannii]PEM44850.1 hypothetical protein CN618_28250 [Bacillus wiedmannii]